MRRRSTASNRRVWVDVDDLPIGTTSLVLRRLAREDAAGALLLSNERRFREWLPSQVYANAAEAESALDFLVGQYAAPGTPRLGAYVLAIDHKAHRQLIGHVGFSPIDHDVEIGFAIGEGYQRRGLGTEAVVAACCWAFGRFELARIVAVTAAGNAASKGLLARAGFEHEEDRVMNFQGAKQLVNVYALSSKNRAAMFRGR